MYLYKLLKKKTKIITRINNILVSVNTIKKKK